MAVLRGAPQVGASTEILVAAAAVAVVCDMGDIGDNGDNIVGIAEGQHLRPRRSQ